MSSCNAFYLNLLVLEGGTCVKPHINCSLSNHSNKFIAILAIVSVLYVHVPLDLQGGELILQNRDRLVGQIQPQTSALLHFQGHLIHLVNQVKSLQARLSLVCEQYKLNETQLQQIPKFEIQYKAV